MMESISNKIIVSGNNGICDAELISSHFYCIF